MSKNITKSNLELWDVIEAKKQITHDGLLDTAEVMNQPKYFINQLTGSTLDKIAAEARINGIFDIAIKLGQIKDPDTPSNWIAWAKRKGFDIDHLDQFNNFQESILTSDTLEKVGGTDIERRRNKQIAAIIEHANALEYPLMSIPYGGKKKIKDTCLKNFSLFTDSSFDHAWKEAKRKGLIEVENIDSYR
ncbi:hypothetical protein SAMN06296273_2163 [Nitrosomonas ureae]|uniref:Uncharacterized protein n=1 Tax=Nitrosomonas ureae TaxID=44577 RepID=A0A285C0Y1_9PROT|nr:hypothetical protein [Nitrosomonas ureae]SNX60693.1 hypothetical protein SAMN06296273_2163 [Nitrosomonas ureae]